MDTWQFYWHRPMKKSAVRVINTRSSRRSKPSNFQGKINFYFKIKLKERYAVHRGCELKLFLRLFWVLGINFQSKPRLFEISKLDNSRSNLKILSNTWVCLVEAAPKGTRFQMLPWHPETRRLEFESGLRKVQNMV